MVSCISEYSSNLASLAKQDVGVRLDILLIAGSIILVIGLLIAAAEQPFLTNCFSKPHEFLILVGITVFTCIAAAKAYMLALRTFEMSQVVEQS